MLQMTCLAVALPAWSRGLRARAACVLLLSLTLTLAWTQSEAGPGEAALTRAFASLPETCESDSEYKQYADFWSLIDSEVVRALNAGRSISLVQELLQTLPGYEGPRKSDGIQLGCAVFYKELGSATPSYRLMEPDPNDHDLLVGTYNHKWYSPGHLSVYVRVRGAWGKKSTFDGELPIEIFVLPKRDRTVSLATVETFLGGDRIERTLRLWRLRAGKLVRQEPAYNALVDFEAIPVQDGLSVRYSGFLECLCEPTLGTRLHYELILRSRSKRVEVVKSSLTPWLEVLNDLYCRVSAHDGARAAALFVNPTDIDVLKPDCATVSEHDGDVGRGSAYAVVEDHAGTFRMKFVRSGEGAWKIGRVTQVK